MNEHQNQKNVQIKIYKEKMLELRFRWPAVASTMNLNDIFVIAWIIRTQEPMDTRRSAKTTALLARYMFNISGPITCLCGFFKNYDEICCLVPLRLSVIQQHTLDSNLAP